MTYRDAMGEPLPQRGPPVSPSKLPPPAFRLIREPVDGATIQSAMMAYLAEVGEASSDEVIVAMREWFGPEVGRDADQPYKTSKRTRFAGHVVAVMKRKRLRTLRLVEDLVEIVETKPRGGKPAAKVRRWRGVRITDLGRQRAAAGLV